jgi:hypothetical protein
MRVKTLFVSLLALPATAVLESVALQLTGASVVSTRKSGAIICDCGSGSALEQHDLRGHHRYYGRSAYP